MRLNPVENYPGMGYLVELARLQQVLQVELGWLAEQGSKWLRLK